MRYSYYPGCTLKTRAKELDRYARLSAAALGADYSGFAGMGSQLVEVQTTQD